MHMQLNRRRAWIALALVAFAGAALGLRGIDDAPPAAATARPLAVLAAPVALEPGYQRAQRFVGRVEFAQASEVSFELGGKVARVLVDEGDPVAAGAVLAELDTARLQARRAELVAARSEARALLELAKLRDRRARRMLEEDVIAPQRADDARLEASARAAALAGVEARIASLDVDLAKSVLRAPFAGEVAGRQVDAGVVVEAGHPVVRLLETSRPEVRVGVARQVAALLAEGDPVELLVDGERIDARVLAVLPERRRETRTVPVRLAVETAEPALREGDLAELAWREPVAMDGFWLPRAALTEGARGLWAVYVAAPESADAPEAHRLERRPVEVLHEEGERVFARGALRAGEAIVHDGVHRLVPGQLVHVAPPPAPVARAVPAEPAR